MPIQSRADQIPPIVKILVADDHDRMRAQITKALAEVAHQVIECVDGREAVRLHGTQQPDLTLMDLEMPGMDGLSATRAIRKAVPSARVLILTAHDSPALRSAAREAGAAGYALKSELHLLPELVRAARAPAESPANLNP